MLPRKEGIEEMVLGLGRTGVRDNGRKTRDLEGNEGATSGQLCNPLDEWIIGMTGTIPQLVSLRSVEPIRVSGLRDAYLAFLGC